VGISGDLEADSGSCLRGGGRGLYHVRGVAVWIAVIFIFLVLVGTGLLIAAITVFDGNGIGYKLARLGFAIPLLAVGVMTALLALDVGRLSPNPRVFLLATAIAGAIGNLVIPFIALGRTAWGALIPLGNGWGQDFRQGLYDPAAIFSSAESSWPPLTLFFGRPLTLLGPDSGYIVHSVVLVVLGVGAAVLSTNLANRATVASIQESGGRGRSPMWLFCVSALWLVTSFGFLMEVERGQMNLHALFFSLLAVWCLLRFPRSLWLPAISLAIAINLKVFPGVLLVILFWRHRWRALVPVAVSNAALLLVAGPGNAWSFLKNGMSMESSAYYWSGNHSAAGFAQSIHRVLEWFPTAMEYVFLAIPVALWVCTGIVLMKRGWSQRNAVLLAAASMPVMNIVPAASHDYKLVLLVFPLAVLAMLLAEPARARLGSSAWRSTFLGLLGLEMVALSASTVLFWGRGAKYPFIVFVQLLILGVVLLTRRQDDPEYQKGSMPGSRADTGREEGTG
jgi:hypothetical protein